MTLGLYIPLALIVIMVTVGWKVYRRKIDEMSPDTEHRTLPVARLTAEHLRALSTPPWRVVYEVGGKLGEIDHVVIGPTGVVAIESMMVDRPAPDASHADDPQRVADAAIRRGPVDDITRPYGVPCDRLARTYWGVPQPEAAAGIPVTHGLVAVEGQRLSEWLVGLPPGPLAPTQVDQLFQAIVVAIGRPDPFA